MFKSFKNKAYGLIACITVAITSIQLSEYLGIHLLGFEKSPISPIMIAIIIGISIANFNSIIINYDEKSESLFSWYQQLVAESLGKKKTGLLPIFFTNIAIKKIPRIVP